jgi:predicted Ser/Thr protein kinase
MPLQDTVVLDTKKKVQKGQNQTVEKQLDIGCFKFFIEIDENTHPSSLAQGSLVLRSSDNTVLKEMIFQLFGSLYLHRTLSGQFSLLKEKSPYTLSIQLTSDITQHEFDVKIRIVKTWDICQSFYFNVEGDISLEPSQVQNLVNFQAIADIPASEREKAIQEFNAVDNDKNGKLDEDEFFDLLKKFYPPITRPEAVSVLSQIDLNRNHFIDLEEFLEAYVYCGSQLHTYDSSKRKLVSSTFGSQKPTAPPTENNEPPPLPPKPVDRSLQHPKTDFEWEIPFQQISFQEKLGEGTFGVVHKGKWRGLMVAAKQLKFQNLTQDVIDEFQKELSLLGKLRHPNVVLLMGASTAPPNLCMVTEFLAGGSLFEIIHQRKQQFPLSTILKMALQTACGLNYLHLSNPPIIHRDLKSMNLLVDLNHNVKLCDFGLSCVKPKGQNLREVVGSPFWMAPEVIQGLDYDAKADVYSFAVCVFEMLTGTIPFNSLVTSDPSTIRKLYDTIISGQRAPLPQYIIPSAAKLITECWAPSPTQRPSFEDIITRLEAISTEHESQQQQTAIYSNYYYNPQQQQYCLHNSQAYYQAPSFSDPYQNYHQQYQAYQQQHSQFYQPYPYNYYHYS